MVQRLYLYLWQPTDWHIAFTSGGWEFPVMLLKILGGFSHLAAGQAFFVKFLKKVFLQFKYCMVGNDLVVSYISKWWTLTWETEYSSGRTLKILHLVASHEKGVPPLIFSVPSSQGIFAVTVQSLQTHFKKMNYVIVIYLASHIGSHEVSTMFRKILEKFSSRSGLPPQNSRNSIFLLLEFHYRKWRVELRSTPLVYF